MDKNILGIGTLSQVEAKTLKAVCKPLQAAVEQLLLP